jgi:hypothetical protein
MANSASRRFSHEEMLGRAFYRIAWNIRSMWEEKGSSDTRLLIEPMIPDDFVLVGQSKAAVDKANQYKEHVVPRMMRVPSNVRAWRVRRGCWTVHSKVPQNRAAHQGRTGSVGQMGELKVAAIDADRMDFQGRFGLRETRVCPH